jgi:hypothetical protein
VPLSLDLQPHAILESKKVLPPFDMWEKALLLTTEALLSEIKEEKKAALAGPPGGGMGDMY